LSPLYFDNRNKSPAFSFNLFPEIANHPPALQVSYYFGEDDSGGKFFYPLEILLKIQYDNYEQMFLFYFEGTEQNDKDS
jgi:hypothetical protein